MRVIKKLKWILVAVPVLFSLTSCGTMFYAEKSLPALTITSSVPNADVYINGRYVGETPYNYFGSTPAKKITVTELGYKSQTIRPAKLRFWAKWNFFPSSTWIWGYFVDKKKEKCWKYKDNRDTYYFVLEKRKRK